MSTRLIELIENLPQSNIVLVGDFMLDRYIFGRTDRISPEAPVPVIRYDHEEYRLGGAGFVLADLAALGAKVTAVGVTGIDEPAKELRQRISACGANPNGLVELNDRPTVTKVRLLGSSQDRTPQQMIRLDIEQNSPVAPAVAEKLLNQAAEALKSAALLCLEDYNKGVLTPEVCAKLIHLARARKIPVIIDPANIADYSKYRGATALKLNRPEAERATGVQCRDEAGWQAASEMLLATFDLEAVVITLNEIGAYLATRDGQRRLLTSRPRQVADATGAGDQVLATICVSRLAGATWAEAVTLANVAGGLEVEKLGCVPITPGEIIQELLAEQQAHLGKERKLAQLLPELARHRAAGRKIVFTNGCFDIMTLGHVKYFKFAREQGDLLVVGVNTDIGIRRLKGPKRPIVEEEDRCGVLEGLESIDYLVRFDDDTPIELIKAIQPDVLVKGADYKKEDVVGWDVVEARGGRVALAPLIDGRSTSNIIKKILEAYS
jgi:D-beta-D-heptose 7-phosphate kinase/D-beta-D-heptose 1-phosphate adenosyltransferase